MPLRSLAANTLIGFGNGFSGCNKWVFLEVNILRRYTGALERLISNPTSSANSVVFLSIRLAFRIASAITFVYPFILLYK